MAVNPVEYVKDSSTPSFANAGDKRDITSSNANTIKKDVDQGNTKDLTIDQEKYLEGNVDYDTLDYSEEEMGKVGEQQIDTTGEDGEDLSEKDEKGGAAAATSVAAASAGAGITAAIAAAAGAKISDGFTACVLGGVAVGASATTLTLSFPTTFDPNLEERKTQTSNAATNNTTIQNYADTLSSDMDMMNEDTKIYSELSSALTESQVETITEVGALQAEMMVYQSQGNSAKVAEIKAQIEALQKGSEEANKEPKEEMDGLKSNIETYTGNSAEASGVKTSGDTVANFLKDGKPMANMAKASGILSGVAALGCMAVIPIPKIWAGFIAVDGAAAVASKIMFIAAGLAFGYAATNFNSRADEESAASDAGTEMDGYLTTLQQNIDAQAGFTETTSGVYAETDEASTETVSENQEAADEANANQATNLANQKKNKPKNENSPTTNVA